MPASIDVPTIDPFINGAQNTHTHPVLQVTTEVTELQPASRVKTPEYP